MAGPVQQPITAYQGDEFALINTVANITTDQIAEAWFTIKTRAQAFAAVDDTDRTAQVTLTGGGITVIDSTNIFITVSAATTALWSAGIYQYDVQIRTTAGKRYTLTFGALTVIGDVTKAS